jgi:hypothetical protein
MAIVTLQPRFPMDAFEEARMRTANWGRQTIAFAISLRAEDDGQPLDDPRQVRHASTAMDKVAAELWDEASRESGGQTEIVMRFARKVLDWIADHRMKSL